MLMAEIHGKFPTALVTMEDLLTSNVFSFLKYTDRGVFLKGYLERLGLSVSSEEAEGAEFVFWPRYPGKAEADLAITVGRYHILLEAKYLSGFSDEAGTPGDQLRREIACGKEEADAIGKQFVILVITADYYFKAQKFEMIPDELRHHVLWTNWQAVAAFLEDTLSNLNLPCHLREFALDLYRLLDRKGLRAFRGMPLPCTSGRLASREMVFFDARTAGFRGEFTGFAGRLCGLDELRTPSACIFFGRTRFGLPSGSRSLGLTPQRVFYERRADT